MNAFPPRTSTLAVVSLVAGVVCWIAVPFVGAIVAIVCGHMARAEIRRAPPGTMEGDSMAVTGLVLGWVHLALAVLAVIGVMLFFGSFAVLLAWLH